LAQRRDLAVLNFSESLTVAGNVSFKPTGLQFGSFVERHTFYEDSKHCGDRLIIGRAMARQIWPKSRTFRNSEKAVDFAGL